MTERFRPYHWRDDAACSGIAEEEGYIFWGTEDQPQEEIDRALSYCNRCTVKVQCLREAGPSIPGIHFIRGGKLT